MKRTALAVLALSAIAVGACGDEQADVRSAPATTASIPVGWSPLPSPPFHRFRGSAVWTGTELVYWGGESEYGDEVHDDGAAFNPATGIWRTLAASPLSPRSGAAAVWTGEEMLIWGGGQDAAGDGAAYDPAADEWRIIRDSPLGPRIPVGAVWTGTEMLVWGSASRAAEAVDGAAYDPAADTWRDLPPAPFPLNEASVAWTGEELIVFGALLDGNN